MKKTLTGAVVTITAFAVATRALGFLFRILLSRTITPDQLGIYQISLSIFLILLTIVSSGLPLSISKEVAKIPNQSKNNTTLWRCISAGVVTCLVASAALCGIVYALHSVLESLFPSPVCVSIIISLLPAVIASSVYSSLRGAWWGQKKFFLLGLSEFIEQVLRILFFVIMLAPLFNGLDKLLVASISLTISCILSALFVFIVYLKQGGKFTSGKNHYKNIIKSAAPITATRTISSLIQPIISIIIPLRLVAAGLTETQALSQFGIALGMTFPLLFLPCMLVGSLATALVPEISQAVQQNKTDLVNTRIKNALKFTIFISFAILPIFIGLGPQIGLFLFNNAESGIFLKDAAWMTIPLSLSLITNSILNSLGLEVKASKHYLIGAAFLLVSIWVLPEYIGINALQVGMGGCMTIATVLNLNLMKKSYYATHNMIKNLLIMCGIVSPCVLICAWAYTPINLIFGNFLAICGSSALALIFFATLCHIFNINKLNNIIMYFKKNKVNT